MKYRFTLFFISFIFFANLLTIAATRTASVSGAWNNSTTWGGVIPGSADDVVIPVGKSVTLTGVGSCNSLNISGSLKLNTTAYLNYTGSSVPIVSGTLNCATANSTFEYSSAISSPVVFIGNYYNLLISGGATKTIDNNSANILIAGNLSITGSATIFRTNNNQDQVITVAGNIIGDGNLSLPSYSSPGAQIYVGGNYLNYGNLDLSGGNLIIYYSSSPQIIKGGFYDGTVTLNGGTKTLISDGITNTTVTGDFYNNATSLIFDNTNNDVIVYLKGNIYNSPGAIIDMSNSSNANYLEINGNINSCFTLLPGTGSEVSYNSNFPQTVCGGTYANLYLYNGGNSSPKIANGNLTITSFLYLNGGVLSVNGFNLWINDPATVGSAGFGSSNKISFSPTGTNKLYIQGNTATRFKNLTYPIGFGGTDYQPVIINTITGTVGAGSYIGIRPIVSSLGTNSVSRMYDVTTSGFSGVSLFDAIFTFGYPGDVNGIPQQVKRNGTTFTGSSITISGVAGQAGVGAFQTQTPNAVIDGLYYAKGGGSAFYRSKNNGNWNTANTWDVSIDNGLSWLAAGTFPGAQFAADIVSIAGTNAVTISNTLPNILGRVTINGGAAIISNAGAVVTFGGTVVNNGGMTMAGDVYFQNGLIYNTNSGPQSINLSQNTYFITNNQTFTGISSNAFTTNFVSVVGIKFTNQTNAFWQMGAGLNGTDANSIFENNAYTYAEFGGMPMATGVLVSSLSGCTFTYNSSLPQQIKPIQYYYLQFLGSGLASLIGDVLVTNKLYLSGPLDFGAGSARTLQVDGELDAYATIGMNASGIAHELILSSYVYGYSGSGIVGGSGSGRVTYRGTSVQNILGGSYNNLSVTGTSKSLGNNIVVNNLEMGGSVVQLGVYNLTTLGITGGTFGGSNMIAMNGSVTGGSLYYLTNNTASDFIRTYPVGTNIDYTPMLISSLSPNTPGTQWLGIQLINTTGGTNQVNRSFKVSNAGSGVITNLNASFGFVPADLSGTAAEVFFDNPAAHLIAGGTVAANSFTTAGAFGYTLNGIFHALTPPVGLFRSTGSGNWSSAIWEVSTNAGVSFQSTVLYPGQSGLADIVSISGTHTINTNGAAILPLAGLTVSGIYNHDLGSVIISGNTLINSGAQFNVTGSGNYAQFQGSVVVNSVLGVNAGSTIEFQNGFVSNVNNGLLNGNIWFTTNNQSISGLAGVISFQTGNVSVVGAITLTQNATQTFYYKLNGTSPLSVFELGSGNLAASLASFEPMKTGNLVVSASGSTFQYNGGGTIKPAIYNYLKTFTYPTTLSGATQVLADYTGTSTMFFPTTVASSLIVNGNITNGSIDMSAGNLGHVLSIGGNFSSGIFNAGKGTVEYYGSSPQTINSAGYYNLIVSGNSVKTSPSNGFSVSSILGLNGGVIDLGNVLSLNQGASILAGTTLGVNNMIRCPNTTAIGFCLVRTGNSAADFNGFTFPIGNTLGYSPVTINSFSASTIGGGSVMLINPFSFTTTSNNFINRGFLVTTVGISSVTDFQPVFSYSAGDVVTGSPYEVDLKVGSTFSSALPSSFVNTGNSTFGINGSGNTTINGYWVAQSLNPQTIVGFAAIPAQPITNATYVISNVTATSGLPVSFASSNPSIASISGNTIIFISGGVVTITATQVGNGTYGAAVPVAQVLAIVPDKPLGNRGIYFDGVDDQIKSSSQNLNDFTFEFWIKTKQTGGTETLNWFNNLGLIDCDGGSPANDYGISLGNGRIVFGLGDDGASVGGAEDFSIFSTSVVNNGAWHHVAVTRTLSSIKIYIDGVLDKTGSAVNIPGSLGYAPLTFGSLQANSPGLYFNGQLDEIKIFNTVRSASEIAFDMASTVTGTAGLVSYWNFENSTGLVATDVQGGNDGNLLPNAPAGNLPLWALRVTNNSDFTAQGSLRWSINQANTDSDKDYIDFSLSSGIQTISPTTTYTLNNPVYVDGFTQLNTLSGENSTTNGNAFGQPINAKLNIVVNGASLINNVQCGFYLNLAASNSIIKGLVMNGYTLDVNNASVIFYNNASNNTISGCFFGTDRNGIVTGLNSNTINFKSLNPCSQNVIGGYSNTDRNLIGTGISNFNSLSNSTLTGNYFGTDVSGANYLGASTGFSMNFSGNNLFDKNIFSSYLWLNASSNTKIINNFFGTKADGLGYISSNDGAGIDIGNTTATFIANNIIANKGNGINVQNNSSNNTFSGNNIFNNTTSGITLQTGGSGGNNNKAAPIITSANSFIISGTCSNGDLVQVFNDFPQSGATNQGRFYVGDATTIGTNWTFNGGFAGNARITATATDNSNGTSAFSLAQTVVGLNPFITTWQTTVVGESITIPTFGSGYNYFIDWGDGSPISFGLTGNANHIYTTTGIHTVSISGAFPSIYFNNSGDKDKIVNIAQWGDIAWGYMANAFNGCSNLGYSATDAPNLSGVTDLSGMFANSNFNGNINNWTVTGVTNMSYMFINNTVYNQPLNNWNTSNVTDINHIFDNAIAFNQPLNNWNTGNVINMYSTFRSASAFNGDISSWNVTKVTDFTQCFNDALAFNQPLNGWAINTVNGVDMRYMFANAPAFNQPLNNWNVSKVTDMQHMFRQCTVFNQDLSSWNVSNVTNMDWMLAGSPAFDQSLANWNITAVGSMADMLDNNGISTPNYDATLISWAAQAVKPNVPLGANGLTYCSSYLARNALSSSPNNWTITADAIQSTACLPDKPIGNRGVYFDGVDDYVSTAVPTSINATLEAWVKIKDLTKFSTFVSNTPGVNSSGLALEYRADGKIYMRIGSIGSIGNGSFGTILLPSTNSILANKWYHISGTYNGSVANIYVNGVLENTIASPHVLNSTSTYWIGSLQPGAFNNCFGQIDEVRIFNSARTQAQIQLDMATTAPNGAEGYWNFEETNGNTANDISGNGNDGFLNNGILRVLRVTDNTDNNGTGLGSLRQAINEANLDTDQDYIDFSIQQTVTGLSGVSVISPTTQLSISESIFIDGYSAYGTTLNSANFLSPMNQATRVELDFSLVPDPFSGLSLTNVSNSTIQGLSLYGIGSGFGSRYNFVFGIGVLNSVLQGSLIGVKANGSAAGGMNGIGVNSSSFNNRIGGYSPDQFNLISSHIFDGLQIAGLNNTIVGNYIGTDYTGLSSNGNGGRGISVNNSDNKVLNNLISGNGASGIIIQAGANNTVVKGNYVGLKGDLSALPNAVDGIKINEPLGGDIGDNSTIGGINAGEANVIAYNGNVGISVDGTFGSNGHIISGNSIFENGTGGISLVNNGNNNKSAPVVLVANSIFATGTCTAGDVVEVFDDSPQFGITNQGRTYLGQAITTGTDWTYTGSLTGGNLITATATDNANGTSPFSNAVIVFDPSPGIYRSIATGSWSSASIWEVSTDSGLSFNTSSYYPGQIFANDLVSISGGNTVTLNVNPKPIDGLTVSGTLAIQNNDFTVSGTSKVLTGGILRDNTGLGKTILIGELINTGTFDFGVASNLALGNGFVNLGSLQLNNVTFGGTNQTITGGQFVNGTALIQNNIKVTKNGSQLSFNDGLNGEGVGSIYESESTTNIGFSAMPMQTGQLIATFPGNTFYYNNGSQFIKEGVYFNLLVNVIGASTLTGNTTVLGTMDGYSTGSLEFPAITTTLEIQGNLNGPYVIDMSTGNLPHLLRLGGSFTQTGTFNRGNGITEYYASSSQNIRSIPYSGLILSGGSIKTALGDIEVNQNLILAGAVLDMGNNRLNMTDTQILSSPGFDFGVTNMIATSTLGYIWRDNACGDNICSLGTYPFGVLSPTPTYLPVTILANDLTSNNSWILRPYVSATSPNSSSSFIKRQLEVIQSGGTPVDFQFDLAFDPTDIVGNPNVVLGRSGSLDSPLLGMYINTTTGFYGVNTTGNSISSGLFFASYLTPKLYVSTASGVWSNPAIWMVSTDSGLSFTSATNYPGQVFSTDLVSISGLTNVTLDVSPQPINGVSITGALTIDASIHITGPLIVNSSGQFSVSTGNPLITLEQGIINNGDLNFGLADVLFTGNNQIVSGANPITSLGNIVLDGISVDWLVDLNFGNPIFYGALDGTDVNSVINFGPGVTINYESPIMPFSIGVLNSSSLGTTFKYASDNGNTPIHPTIYYNLQSTAVSFGGVLSGPTTILGDFTVLNELLYPNTATSLVVYGNVYAGTANDINMSTANHKLFLYGSVNQINSIITGLLDEVHYAASSNQSVAGTSYNSLIIEGIGNKILTGNMSVNNFSILGGNTFDTKQYQITGSASGNMLMESGTTLILGDPLNATPNTFPSSFVRNNISLNPSSKVVYEAGVAQTISSTPFYQELQTGGIGIKSLSAPTTVLGSLFVKQGNFDLGSSGFNNLIKGNVSVTGTYQDNFSSAFNSLIVEGSFSNFTNPFYMGGSFETSIRVEGDFISNNDVYMVGNQAKTLEVLGNFSVDGVVDLTSASGIGMGRFLKLFGTNNFAQDIVTNGYNTAYVDYDGAGDQQMISSNDYSRIRIGSGKKTLSGDIKLISMFFTSTNGTVDIANHDLIFKASGSVNGTFGNTQMISIPTTPGAGFVIKEGNTLTDFFGFTYPIGSNGFYSPVTLVGLLGTPSLGSSIALRPLITVVGNNDAYISRAFEIATNGIAPTLAQIQFSYSEPGERVGQPNQVNKYVGGSYTSLPGMNVNTVAGTFGFSGGITDLNGLYVASNPNIPPTLTGLNIPLILCQNGSYNATISGTGSGFLAGNIFTLIQADNSDINYTTPTVIGTVAGVSANFIYNFTLPGGISIGKSRFRIEPSISNQAQAPEKNNIDIIGLPQLTGLTPSQVFVNDKVTFTGSSLLSLNGITVSGVTLNTIITPNPNPNSFLPLTITNATIPFGLITVTGSNQCGISVANFLVNTFMGVPVTSISMSSTGNISTQGGIAIISATALNLPYNPKVTFNLVQPSSAQFPLATIIGTTITSSIGNANTIQIQGLDNGVVTIVATSISNPNISNSTTVSIINQAVIKVSIDPANNLCAGQFYSASTTISGSGPSIMNVELSNAAGSFASPTVVGSALFAPGITSNIPFSIPGNALGTGYRIRVTAGTFLSYDNGTNITINPSPKFDLPIAPLVAELCFGTKGNIIISNSQTTSVYRLYNSSGSNLTGLIAGNGGNLSISVAGTNLGLGNNTFTIRTSSNVGCGTTILQDMNNTATFNVVQNPTPTNAITASKPAICQGDTVSIVVANAETGVVYSLFNNAIALNQKLTGTGSNLVFVVNADSLNVGTNNFTLTGITPACSVTSPLINSVAVISVELPTVLDIANQDICSGNSLTVSLTGIPQITSFDWQVTNVVGSVFGQIDGSGNVISQSLNGIGNFDYVVTPSLGSCVGSPTTFNVRLTTPPRVGLSVESITVCGGPSATIRVYNAEVGVTYFPRLNATTFSGNSIIVNNDVELTIPQSSLTGSNNQIQIFASTQVCTPRQLDSLSNILVVSPVAIPSITGITTGIANCDKLNLKLQVTTFAGYLSYQWRWNGREIIDSTANSAVYAPVIDGTYTVDVFSTNNCRQTTDPFDVTLKYNALRPTITSIGFGTNIILQASIATSYQWYYGKKAIVGEINQSYTPLYNALYNVKINPGDLCSLRSDDFAVTGFADNLSRQPFEQTDSTILIRPRNLAEKPNLKLYPNPAKQKVNLSFDSGNENASATVVVRFVNSIGIELYKTNYVTQNGKMELDIDISTLPSGIYKVIVSESGHQFIGSLAIE